MQKVTNQTVTAAGTTLYTQGTDFHISWKQKVSMTMRSKLTFGSGGTSIKVFLQTSFDGGLTWHDRACLAFLVASLDKHATVTSYVVGTVIAAASDGALADDTIVNGQMGRLWRVKVVTAGTYAGGTLLETWLEYQDS